MKKKSTTCFNGMGQQEEIKAGKEGVHDRSEFHQKVSILNLRNLRIILKYCALQWWAQMLIETKGMDG